MTRHRSNELTHKHDECQGAVKRRRSITYFVGMLSPVKSRQRYIQKAKLAARVFLVVVPYRKSLVVLFLFMITGTCFGLVGPYMSKLFIDVVFRPDPSTGAYEHAGMLVAAVGVMFGAQALQQLLTVFRTRFSSTLGNSMLYDIRATLYEKLQGLSLSFFDKQQTGALISRVNQDTAELQRFMVDFFPVTLESLLLFTGASIFLLVFNWQLTVVVVLPLLASALLLKKLLRKMGALYRDYFERRSKLSAQASDAILGIRVVKVFGQEAREIAAFNEKSGLYRDAGINLGRQASIYSPAFSFFIILASSGVWMAGGEMVLLKKMTLGSIIAFLGYLAMVYRPVMTLGQLLGTVAGSLSAAQRVFEIIDAVPEVVESRGARNLPSVKGKIEFRDVSFGYDGRPVLKGCSFVIEPGQRAALVGKSGSGKSTVASVLCRLYEVGEAAVFIDDVDIRAIRLSDLRRHVGMVPQDAFLFDGTIFDNIAYPKPGASKEEVVGAARAALAHDFIMAKPDGYDTVVGERGVMLSGGEKQRIALARALVHDPAILVLDEATSAVDTATESAVLSAIERLPRISTVMCIAHRLLWPESYGKLLVMDDGSIVETGTHAQLMAQKGVYYSLYTQQERLGDDTLPSPGKGAPHAAV